VALVAPCPQHGCDEPIILGVEDIGKTLLPLPQIKLAKTILISVVVIQFSKNMRVSGLFGRP
jgi:hypothetical protein